MDSRSVAERVREIAEQVAVDHGLELVHAEIAGPDGHPILRVFIDKPGGVTHENCSEVSVQLGTVLDVEDLSTRVTPWKFRRRASNGVFTNALITSVLRAATPKSRCGRPLATSEIFAAGLREWTRAT